MAAHVVQVRASAETQRRRALLDNELGREDWQRVFEHFEDSGRVSEIALRSGLEARKVNYLLDFGVQRLGLPPVRQFAIDKAAINLRLAEDRARREADLRVPEVREAATERAATEAQSAQELLARSMATGALHGEYVKRIMRGLEDGSICFDVPRVVTLKTLLMLARVLDAHSRALERAIKLIQLTAGSPVHSDATRIATALGELTDEELVDAANAGKLPARLRYRR